MIKYLTCNTPVINLYKKGSEKSEVVTQLIYGESFSIIKKSKKWYKIKIKEDNYKGFIKKKNFFSSIKATDKVSVLKSKIYKMPNKNKVISFLPFGSKIKVIKKEKKFFKFDKGWIERKDVKPVNYKEKDFFKKILIFKNIKYKWGGKTFKGIDCSGLVQICLNFNNIYCPRDAKDQLIYFKKNIDVKRIKKNDILFWKGHVAVALSKKKLIHAYGPMKKTVVMNINKTLERIKKTANLNLKKIKRIRL